MYWYNPKTREMEDVPAPKDDAGALEMLDGHPNSAQFTAEYRGLRTMYHGIEESLKFTGDTFRMVHREEEPSE
ncbi:MAG: hypothetical protein LC781_05185 [Actinobacteria bacterium]|nr:hypothetical protein [Actinomycetota bacterium]